MNKAALDAAFWTYYKATGLNPESHPVIEDAIRQAIEVYLEHANKQPDVNKAYESILKNLPTKPEHL